MKEYYDKDFLKETVIKEMMNSAKKDPVPNVKFSACQVIKDLVSYLKDKDITKEAIEFMKGFENDKDCDVVFFSKQAGKELEALK